jgi:hypothetical protein
MILHKLKSFKNDGCARRRCQNCRCSRCQVWTKNDSDGWVSIGGVTPQVYDLLDLTGGVNVLLADQDILLDFRQVRLILGIIPGC